MSLPDPALAEFFSRLAPDYERHTHILTMGRDQVWRRFLVACMRVAPGDYVLDLACGTGQLAEMAARRQAGLRVTGLDANPQMLALARQKYQLPNIDFIEGDACRTPFADNTFQAVTMGFGLRIMPDRELMLRECLRVLSPGGRAYFLETAPLCGWLKPGMLFLQTILPALLRSVNKKWTGYRRLLDSLLDFPSLDKLHDLFMRQGFVAPRSYAMTPALAHVHVAEKRLRP
jgi:demethylmenaquinone methyltransferase/2-methoxy-6-polyprenyl-1,4-benzoquinol methylase